MFTKLPNEIIISIAKYDVTPLALIIVSKKIYNLLLKKQIQTKHTMTITNYILIDKMIIQDFKYVDIKNIKKLILKLNPYKIYVYWFNNINNRQCGCKHKDVYKLDKDNIIHVSSNRLIECCTHTHIRGIPDLNIGMAHIIEMNMISKYSRYTNYAIEN